VGDVPIYEYECDNKHRFEKWQSIKDEPLTECPECGTPVKKIFHPAGIIFKGSGWYITDSRKTSGGDGKAESKSESKSESKNETKSSADGSTSSS
jgi:putative FmdB family regulatory protein